MLFVEVAELEMIEANGTDPAIDLVKHQIRDFYEEGFELGLHLHPQWYNARYENGKWLLDYSEYNLCTLPRERIAANRRSLDRLLAECLGRSQILRHFLSGRAIGCFSPREPWRTCWLSGA